MLRVTQPVAGLLLAAASGLLCSAQTLSPESAARAVNVTGQVSVMRDNIPWAIQPGSVVQIKQIIVTGADGFAQFEVADGSRFEVFPNSRVVFRANPGDWKDLLDVWLGRVKVYIQKLSGQPNHNRVKTPTAVISVRGTIFDVAVEDENLTLVAVEEGQVAVQHLFHPMKNPKLLNAGENLRVYKDQPLAQRAPNRDAVLQQAMRAAGEAFYRIIYRNPQAPASGGGVGAPGNGGGGAPLPGDTETTPPPPAPPE